jgi:DnaK suppressor protein
MGAMLHGHVADRLDLHQASLPLTQRKPPSPCLRHHGRIHSRKDITMRQLTPEDRSTLVRQLDAMRMQVLNELRDSAPRTLAEAMLNARQEVVTHADQAEAEREDDVRLAEIEVDRQRLQDIEKAQLWLSDGRYGVCVDCGKDIARARLLAQPIAIRCTACQVAREARDR